PVAVEVESFPRCEKIQSLIARTHIPCLPVTRRRFDMHISDTTKVEVAVVARKEGAIYGGSKGCALTTSGNISLPESGNGIHTCFKSDIGTAANLGGIAFGWCVKNRMEIGR